MQTGKAQKERAPNATQSREDILETRQQLPIYQARKEILFEMRRHDTLVLVGETGSGKTTQMPQFLLEAGTAKKGMIGITQPRRVAATSVAARVAVEMGVMLGKEVGYAVRFDDTTSPNTKIKFMTDGMLVREMMLDPQLRRYSVLLLDEAHERSLNTEVLFALVKRMQMLRKDSPRPLKLVVMSATLEAQAYAAFFHNSKVLHVEGRRYPVDVLYTAEPHADSLDAAVTTVLQIHLEEAPGDVLLFLCGQDDIETVAAVLRERSRTLPPSADKLLPCPLYASLPPSEQALAFAPAPAGTRKVVLATNIAESSITIDGIRYIIDNGLVKAKFYHPAIDMECLQEMPVSRAQAQQRTGRAGRVSAGKCFRLYTEDSYEELQGSSVPEIKRCRLSGMVLQLKMMGIGNLVHFEFMEPPPRKLLIKALEHLYYLGALDAEQNVTELGKRMAALPLEPQYAKLLLSSPDFECSEEILSVVSMLSVDTVFVNPSHKREEAHRAHAHLIHNDGDHLTFLQVYNAWVESKGTSKDWCKQHFVNARSMHKAADIRKQLKRYCEQAGVLLASCGSEHTQVARCLVTAFYANAARLAPDGRSYRAECSSEEIFVHPNSSLFRRKARAVVFDQLMLTTKMYMRNCTVIDLAWLPELVPAYSAQLKRD